METTDLSDWRAKCIVWGLVAGVVVYFAGPWWGLLPTFLFGYCVHGYYEARESAGGVVSEHTVCDNGAMIMTVMRDQPNSPSGVHFTTTALHPEHGPMATRSTFDPKEAIRQHQEVAAKVG